MAQAQPQTLDPLTVVATKTEEKVIDSLAAVSAVRQETFDQLMAKRVSDMFFGMPGVWFQERADDPGTAVNIRGLQDFGRVAVVLDGARQNHQRTGHNADGLFYVEPEMISGIDVVRGPVANIYGSGAIGGVVSLQTKDINDILNPGERWGITTTGIMGSNQARGVGSVFTGARINPNVDVFAGGTYRDQSNYKDGHGNEVPNSWQQIASGIAKVTVRPAEGHEVKVTGLTYDANYATGVTSGSTQYRTDLQNHVVTGRYTFRRPDVPLVDFAATGYWTATDVTQTKTCCGAPSASSGAIGDSRKFNIETTGFDIHNSSRFVTGPFRNTLTYGGDFFQDQVNTTDATGTGDLFTPSGTRSVYGGFGQWLLQYGSWLDIITAARYDAYSLSGGAFSTEGDRISPKATVGITPIKGFQVYGTYAEGYRAPAVTETLVAGLHPVAQAPFTFVPNPSLRPEVGKTKEIGVNLKYDDVFVAGDKIRVKANVFRNDVDDFIDQVTFGPTQNLCGIPGVPFAFCPAAARFVFPYTFLQYQNIAQGRLEGVEVEGTYDAGGWFVGGSASHIRGTNLETGARLVKVPPDFYSATAGVRFLDRKLTIAVRWQHVLGLDNNPATGQPSDEYDLVNLYVGYQPTPDVLAGVSVDNLLNQYYVRYLDAQPSPGVTYKGSLKVRFGAT